MTMECEPDLHLRSWEEHARVPTEYFILLNEERRLDGKLLQNDGEQEERTG